MRGTHPKSHATLQLCGHVKIKKRHIFQAQGRQDLKGEFVLEKINTKIQTKTKNVEMKEIVTNSEIRLHNCFCEFRGFKTGRSSQPGVQ